MGYVLERFPWTIASLGSASQPISIDDGKVIVAIIVATQSPSVWTASKIVLTAYVPDSGKNEPGGFDQTTGTWQGGPYDSSAVFTPILNDAGAAIAFGDGANTGLQYIQVGSTTAFPRQIDGVRFVKINSGTVAGAVLTPVAQQQAVSGYLVIREL